MLTLVFLVPRTLRGQLAPSIPAPLKTTRLADDFYIIEGTSDGSADVPNVSVYITGNGIALVDPWFEQDYARIMAAVHSISSQPVRYIFNTHYHSDHSGDNLHFQPVAAVVAHARSRQHMVERKMPGLPDITVNGPATFYLGGKEIRVFPMGTGHTDGDLAIYFPTVDAVCMGDMMAGTRGVTNPVVDYSGGGAILSWPYSLDSVLLLNPKIVIPGHGAITDRNGLLAHRNKVELIGSRLRQWTAERHAPDDIRSLLIKEFDFKPINLRSLDRLIAEATAANQGRE